MKRQLLKALEIASLTGDKIIIVDEKRNRGMVVMGMEEYEKILIKNKREEDFDKIIEEPDQDDLNDLCWDGDFQDDDEDFQRRFLFFLNPKMKKI
jgi:hypothetical protein